MVKKFFKTIVKILLITILSSFLLIGFLRNTEVQSLLANVSSNYLSQKLGVKVWINKVSISSYFRVLLKDVYVYDKRNKPMITARAIKIDYPLLSHSISEWSINYLIVDSAFVNLVQYKGDDGLNINQIFTSNDSLNLAIDTTTIDRKPFLLGLKYLNIINSHFIYKVEEHDSIQEGEMDYEFLDISDINLEIENLHLIDDSIFGNIVQLQAKDRCGVELKNFETYANVGPRHLILKNARLMTNRSHANLDLAFHYDSWWAYLDFINKVNIEGTVRDSKINLEDIAYFAPAMFGMNDLLRVKGTVKGPIRNMKGRNLHLTYGKSTSFNGHLQMTGLPNIYETFLNLKLKDFSSSVEDLQSFKLPGGKQFDGIPEAIQKFGKIRIKGRFTGFYNDFVSKSDIYTEKGMLKTDIQFMNNTTDSTIHYRGDFEARNFDIGSFINMESNFGDINFNLNVKGKGIELKSLDTKVIGQIENMQFRGNALNTIYIDATIKENEFLGSLNIKDDLINTNFVGNISFDSIHPYFDFKAELENVKLAKLGILNIDSSAVLTTNVHMNFTGMELDSINGLVKINHTKLSYKGEDYLMDSLYLYSSISQNGSQEKSLNISSDFLNGGIKGKYSLRYFPKSFETIAKSYINQLNFIEESNHEAIQQQMQFNFKLSNTQTLSKLFMPSLVLSDSLVLKGSIETAQNNIQCNLLSSKISYGGIGFVDPSITIQTENNQLLTHVMIKELVFKEKSKKDSLAFGIDSLKLNMNLHKDSLLFGIDWENFDRHEANSGNVNGLVHFKKEHGLEISFKNSDMVVSDSLWHISNGSRISIDSATYSFDSINFYALNQALIIDGNISTQPNNDLLIHFDNLDISTFDLLLLNYGINLDGFLSGDIKLIDIMQNINFLADLHILNFALNGENMGQAEIKSTRNTDQSVFLNMNLQKEGNKGVYKPLYLEGFYYPNRKQDQIDLDLSIHNLSIGFINVFLRDYVADLEGKATGEVRIGGMLAAPDLSGSFDLARTQFRIKYLNTLYSLSGKLKLDNELLGFDEVVLYDTLGGKAVLKGGLTHQNLKNFGVDLQVHPENFVGLNTRKGMNELFYGKAIITGDLLIKGPFDNVFLDIDATSKQGTDISIPINTTLDVSDNNFIVFVNENDSLSKEQEEQYIPELSSFSLNMDLTLTPEAKVQISLPSQLGLINAEGSGDLNMNLSRTGNFRMTGDYKVSKGLFFFQIRNLFNRKFVLNEGGTISWTGDPYSGTLGMRAKYQVKTSLNSLGLDQDSSYRNRVPVDCIIGLTGPIMNPNIKFDFEFPNATEEVKQYVFTKIDTTNPAEMSQQMLSLLVLNSFSFNNATDNGNIANSVGGSSLQIVANQLSNWLSQISKEVDIGINYRPGGDLTNEEVEVALSTQLFDERVSIDGNFGYQSVQNNPSKNTSSIVGDINVEVKLTKDGRLRLKAFNRTNTVDLMDNTSPYTQGVGIFYRKEFNTISDLFKSKKKKEQEQQEELEKAEKNALKTEEMKEEKEPKQ